MSEWKYAAVGALCMWIVHVIVSMIYVMHLPLRMIVATQNMYVLLIVAPIFILPIFMLLDALYTDRG